jgi:Uma2 family endonuclease
MPAGGDLMTTALQKTTTQFDQVVRLKVSWTIYETLVESLDDDSHVRLTYDGEMLEIRSPGTPHEILARLVATMLDAVSTEWALDITDLGTATFKTEPRGFEADGTYYLDAAQRIRDIDHIDLSIDPPPDLLLEIDITTDSSDKLATYAGMGVSEVWRYNLDGFAAFALADGKYVTITISRVISGLPLAEIAKRLDDKKGRSNMLTFRRTWRQWLQENIHLRT